MHLATDGTAPIFTPGRSFRRRLLHDAYGGQQYGGICTPHIYPFIFLFTGDTGEQYGYQDELLSDGTYRYTGEGQVGDMQMGRGNAAIRDHAANGKDLYLFEKTKKAHVRYLGQMVCTGYETVPDISDRDGNPRTIIVFYLRPIHDIDEQLLVEDDDVGSSASMVEVMPLEELRAQALAAPQRDAPAHARHNVYRRSAAVRAYVLRRAGGTCEGCGAPAPFHTAAGRPYLEPHHIRRLSDGGPDHPDHVISLCPNCHRRVHHGANGAVFNAELQRKVGAGW